MKNVSEKSFKRKKTYFISHNFFSPKNLAFCNVEKYSPIKQATDDSIIRRKRFACWINKARIHRVISNKYLWLFYDNYGFAKARRCYNIFTLPLLLYLSLFDVVGS